MGLHWSAVADGDRRVLCEVANGVARITLNRRERLNAMDMACIEGRNAAGAIHEEGEFADVGATVNAWLGKNGVPRGVPGRPILEP